jgi:transglutaminase-like putative cysteine protease
MRRGVALVSLISFLIIGGLARARVNQGLVTIHITPKADVNANLVRLWVPYPVSDSHQKIEDLDVQGNFSISQILREKNSGALYLFVEWRGAFEKRVITLTFRATAKERSAGKLKDRDEPIPEEVKRYLDGNRWVHTDKEVGALAKEITKETSGVLGTARAVYNWVVENTYRDPDVKGCGLGMADQMLVKRGGKCADISSVFVALARASGVPAREVFGLRLGTEAEQDMTKGHHCWAEFYLPGQGWVPVDPADVRKIMLVKNLDLEKAGPYRNYYFGKVEENRIILTRGGRGITLEPPQASGPINYFMYPFGEVDGKPLDYMDPGAFSYQIRYEKI